MYESFVENVSDAPFPPERGQPGPDNRRHRRAPVEIPGYVVGIPTPELTDDYWDAIRPDSDLVTITNLTALGLQFRGRAYFDEDDHIWIAINLGGDMRPIRGVVIHRSDFKDDDVEGEIFDVGVQFVKSDFAPGAVAAILDFLHPPVKSEPRNARERRPSRLASLFDRLRRKN